jgi:hypothetical protein
MRVSRLEIGGLKSNASMDMSARGLKAIIDQPVEKLEGLSRQCMQKPEREMFTIRRISP